MTARAAQPDAEMDGVAAPVRWALYLFVLSLPYEYPQRTIPAEIHTITGAIYLLATLLQPMRCYRRVPWCVCWFGAFLWAYLVSFAMAGGQYQGEVVKLFVLLVELVLVLWSATNVLSVPAIARRAMWMLVAGCIGHAALLLTGVGATAHVVETGGERLSALGQNANTSARLLAGGLLTLLFFIGRLSPGARRVRWIAWLLAGTLGYAIMQTGSRGGILALAAGLLVLLSHDGSGRARLRHVIAAVAAIGLLAWGSMHVEVTRNRFERAAETGTLAGRERIYPALVTMLRERPLLGWAPIANKYELAARLREPFRFRRDAHNIVLEVLTATGFLGAVPFLIGVWLCVRAAWRTRRASLGALPLALLTTVFVGSMSMNWIAAPLLWLALALAVAREGERAPQRAARGARAAVVRSPQAAGPATPALT